MEKRLEITFELSADADGYNVGDWFKGGWETIALAQSQNSPADADNILRDHYLGPDCDGVTVDWEIA